ncbi:MAG TPA: TetR/AcrR family transcriptional regulator [Candidatus Acidoferrales bacterium]|nr:TetR/AcrR family transcriptional regulator [Candidatus Acidoferrales bacterium]
MANSKDKRAKKRLEILRSAASAFRRHGYHGASVGRIARTLRMTKGSLYYYFKNKEEILYFCHDYSLDLLLNLLKEVEASGAPPDEKLYSLIVAFVHTIIDELNGIALTMDLQPLSPARLRNIIAKRDAFDRGIRHILQAGMQSGAFRRGDPKLLSFAILGAVNWITRWFSPRGPADSDEISRAFADYLIAGLREGNPRSRTALREIAG